MVHVLGHPRTVPTTVVVTTVEPTESTTAEPTTIESTTTVESAIVEATTEEAATHRSVRAAALHRVRILPVTHLLTHHCSKLCTKARPMAGTFSEAFSAARLVRGVAFQGRGRRILDAVAVAAAAILGWFIACGRLLFTSLCLSLIHI